MWILHTSDLWISASTGDVTRRMLANLAQWVKTETRGSPVDFFVVSGNITADGDPASFDAAFGHLATFCGTCLRHAEGGTAGGLPGLVVAPGPNDCSGDGTSQFTAYDDFVRRLYRAEVEAGLIVSEGGTTFRELKAITVISVPYWTEPNASADRHLTELEQLRTALYAQDLPDSAYAKGTPTLLVSSGFPTCAAREEQQTVLEAVRRRCGENQLDIELHLFGTGPATALLREAFGLNHVALGTGRKHKSAWPFRANLIRIGSTRREARSRGEYVYMTNHAYQMTSNERFDTRGHINGQLDLFFRPDLAAADTRSFTALFERLSHWFRRTIVLYGLPGMGKDEFIRQAGGSTDWGGHRVRVITHEVHDYEKPRLFATLRDKVRAEQQEYPDNEIVLLIREVFVAVEAPVQHDRARRFIDEKSDELRDEGATLLILRRSLDLDENLAVESAALPPLTYDEASGVALRRGRVPVPVSDVMSITGRYAGFHDLLFRLVWEAFDALPITERVTPDLRRKLLKRAMSKPAFDREARTSFAIIESIPGGREVCRYIKQAVHQQVVTARDGNIPQIQLRMEVARAQFNGDNALFEGAFKRLDDLGVITANGAEGEYTLNLVAPFLGKLPSQPPPPVPEGRNGAETGSHPHPEGKRLEAFPANVDVLLLAPLEDERDAIRDQLTQRDRVDPLPGEPYAYDRAWLSFRTAEGGGGRYSVALGLTGRGGKNAFAAARAGIDRWQPRYVVLVGIAGGLGDDVKIGDVLIARGIMDCSLKRDGEHGDEIRWSPLQVDPIMLRATQDLNPGPLIPAEDIPSNGRPPKKHTGLIASDDDVIARRKRSDSLKTKYDQLVGVEMEAHGVGQAASEHPSRPRFFMVRAVSDFADGNKDSDHVVGLRGYACRVAATYALGLLERGALNPGLQVKERPRDATNEHTRKWDPELGEEAQRALARMIAGSPYVGSFSQRRKLCVLIGVNADVEFVDRGDGEAFGRALVAHVLGAKGESFQTLSNVMRSIFGDQPPFDQ